MIRLALRISVVLATLPLVACWSAGCRRPEPDCAPIATNAPAQPVPVVKSVVPVLPVAAPPSVPPHPPAQPEVPIPPPADTKAPPIVEKTPLPAPTEPEAATIVTVLLSDAGLALEGEALGKLAGATPEEQDRTLGALRARLLPLVADRANRNADGSSRIQVLVRADRKTKWKYAQWIMQVCSDPAIQIYKIHFQITPKKPSEPNAGTSAR